MQRPATRRIINQKAHGHTLHIRRCVIELLPLVAYGFRYYFTPLPGFFSPFPHGTGKLSVDHEYLALEDGPPIFRQDFSCPALLVARSDPPPAFRIRGYHPVSSDFPDRFAKLMV